jgi:hypothetical protein
MKVVALVRCYPALLHDTAAVMKQRAAIQDAELFPLLAVGARIHVLACTCVGCMATK